MMVQPPVQTRSITANGVDTNEAGDIYADAFLYAIKSGRSYAWAAKFANAASVRVVSHCGPRIAVVEMAN